MSVWIKKYFGRNSYTAEFNRFEQLLLKTAASKEMLMIASSGDGGPVDETIYIWFQNDLYASLFPGFEPVAESDLPTTAALLIGEGSIFEQRFKYGA